MEIKDIVSAKLKNYEVDDVELDLAIAETKQYVSNYCQIEQDEIPTELNFTIANMSVDLIKYQTEVNKDVSEMSLEDAVDPSNIASIKEGDTTITLGISKNATNTSQRSVILGSHTPNLDNIMLNYKQILQEYRKLL